MSPRREAAIAVLELLAERFPKTFWMLEARRRPLKIGVHHDILAALNGAIEPVELSIALRWYCGSKGYLANVLTGAWRLDLDGMPAGTITREEERYAKRSLTGITAKLQAKVATPKIEKPKDGLAELRAAALQRKAVGGLNESR